MKKDLDELGIFDRRMSLYLPYELRQYSAIGFSGFEARHYSLFESLRLDMTQAVNLQALITALAFQYSAAPDFAMGFAVVWNLLMLLFLQAVWVALFLFTGRSETTGSVVSFHVAPAFRNKAAETVSAARESHHVVAANSIPMP